LADTVTNQYGGGTIFFSEQFFETLLMVIIIIWLLRWLFGFNNFYGAC